MAIAVAPATHPIGLDAVRTLRPQDVPMLRLPGDRSSEALRDTLRQYPDRSVWVPETLEYLVLTPWRHRPEIAYVDEFVGIRHGEALLQGAFERCQACGDDLLLAITLESQRQPNRYQRAGMTELEGVITYDLDTSRIPASDTNSIAIDWVVSPDPPTLDLLVSIDHEAFPWLWRNSRQEFVTYIQSPGVIVALVSVAGTPVSYFGATIFAGYAHLDRIAVAPSYQGQGIGRKTLHAAVTAVRRQGARRIGLSTQRTNARSQRLYERFGFRRTPAHDYQLLGRWCGPGLPT